LSARDERAEGEAPERKAHERAADRQSIVGQQDRSVKMALGLYPKMTPDQRSEVKAAQQLGRRDGAEPLATRTPIAYCISLSVTLPEEKGKLIGQNAMPSREHTKAVAYGATGRFNWRCSLRTHKRAR
jgi:hypothetical protein